MSSTLTFGQYTMPAAELGRENPLPDLEGARDLHASLRVDASVPPEDRKYMGYGRPSGILPYTFQDGYDRARRPRGFVTAVLENERLRATFLPELGGRLWSLVDRETGREFLYVNPVFQPANLAVRSAWFSGGVEWNAGVIGHSPLTCSPLFTAQLRSGERWPVLRMYEWERIRQAVYQIDAYLPPGSRLLHVRVRIENTLDREVPMYWWSNIAVPESEDLRVIVPAGSSYGYSYDRTVTRSEVPHALGTDASYPTNLEHAADFFYRIPDQQRPFIAVLDGSGAGLVQTSTRLLKGRKLFVWGMGRGGRRWQEFLSVPGKPYFEIQAGLARTQLEHIPMPAHAVWEWVEAYGPIQADPAVVHGGDWSAAWRAVAAELERIAPAEELERELEGTRPLATSAGTRLRGGSGWAAVELERRRLGGEPLFAAHLDFTPDPGRTEHEDWLALLRKKSLPHRPVREPPGAWMVQGEWLPLLRDAMHRERGNHWRSWLHLGVMLWVSGDTEAALEAWQRSVALEPSAWALRNLAVAARKRGEAARAAELMLEACRMRPAEPSLLRECTRALIEAGRPAKWIELAKRLPPRIREIGRMRFLDIRALLESGRLEDAERLLTPRLVVADLREGETSLTELWFDLQARKLASRNGSPVDEELRRRVRAELEPPAWMDFRMS